MPTPTPFPDLPPMVNVPIDQFRIWNFAKQAVGIWNEFGTSRTDILQWAILLVIVVVSVVILVNLLRDILPSDDNGKTKK
jgi:hypothetical protein